MGGVCHRARIRATRWLAMTSHLLPDEQITQRHVHPHLKKYIPSRLPQIKSITRAVSSHRGAIAIVTNAGRDAVDAAAPARN
jgi:hypothetical protein